MPPRQEIPNLAALPARPIRGRGLTIVALAAMALYWALYQSGTLVGTTRRLDMMAMVLRDLGRGELLQEWFSGPPLVALLERMALLVPTLLVLAGAAALGWLIVRALLSEGTTRLEGMVFSAAVGLNAMSTWVLAVGLGGGLRQRWLLAAPLAVAAVVAAVVMIRARRSPQTGPPPPVPIRSWPGGAWLWLAAPLVVLLLATAVLPPSEFDVREYHLQAPKEFYQAGHIGFLPHNVYANMPLGTEMLSLLAMSLLDDWWRGALVGKLLTASFALFGAIGLLAAGRRLFSTGAGVVAALAYLTTPWIFFTSAAGLIDAVLAFYLLAALLALLLWRPSSGMGMPTLSGYLAGAAVATKYPGMLFVVLPLAVAVGAIGWRRARSAVRPLTMFLLAVLLGCGLWLAKNWVLTGNPTYPLLYSVFGGKTWDAEKDSRWNRIHRPHDFSVEGLVADLKRVAWQSPWQSPVLVPLTLMGALGLTSGAAGRTARRNGAILAGLMFYVLAAWWLLTHRIDRFWIPALPLAALLAGQGACWSPDRLWRWPLAVILAMAVAYSLLMAFSGAMGDNRYFHRLAELRENPRPADPWHQFFNQHAEKRRVLLIGEARVFDLEGPILYATCFDDLPLASLAAGQGAAQVHAELLERGVSFVYVDWSEIERYRRPGNYGFSPIPQPALFHQLVSAGVLEPLPPIPENAGRAYRVRR